MIAPKRRNKKGVLYFRRISETLKAQFKAACYRRGKSMTEVVVAMMTEYAGKDK